MKTVSFCWVSILLILIGCNKNGSKDISVEQISLERNIGNCTAKKGGCINVKLGYQIVHGGEAPLREAVNNSVQKFIVETLVMGEIDSENNIEKIDTALIELEEEFKDFLDDLDYASADWFIESFVDITYNDTSYLALNLSNYSYQGGAHPNTNISKLIFDKNSGEEITIINLVTDVHKLTKLLEEKFREQLKIPKNASLNENGFWFENDEFHLPANIGLSNDGVEFFYNSYEIAPYAMGVTDIIIPFEELRQLGLVK